MALRPSQLRAAAAESAYMIPGAMALRNQYGKLAMPVAIIAGEEDRIVDTGWQSARLHRHIPQSRLHRVAGGGHMIHQSATERVWAAVQQASAEAAGRAVDRAENATQRGAG